jgi:hypothetical protein
MNYHKADRKEVLVNKLTSIITEMNSTLDTIFQDFVWFQHDMTTDPPVDGLYADNIEQSMAIMAQMANSIAVAARRAGLLTQDSNILPAG